MIRAILFDLDGTLIDRDGARRRYGLDLAARRLDPVPPAERDDLLRVLHERAGRDRDRHTFARRVVSAFPKLGPLEEIAEDYARRIPGFIVPDEALVRIVESLARRYVLGVVSNGSGPVQRAKLGAAGLSDLFEYVLVSGEQRASKPHPALFRRALDRVRAMPGETLFVGDDPALDIAAAARVAMKTCWVRGGREYPAGVVRPDRTIERIHDIEEALS